MSDAPGRGVTLDYANLQEAPKPPGMIVFAIIFCLAAALFGCFAALMPLTMFAPRPTGTPPAMTTATLIPAVVLYLFMAAGFIVLAAGCFMMRRWVPVVMRAIAWPMLVGGVIYIPIVAIIAWKSPPPPNAPAFAVMAGVIGAVVFGLLFVVGFPLACILYFRRESLAHALARRQPDPGYVARQPARMAALWIWPLIVAVTFLAGIGRPVLPVFGTLLTGIAGAIAYVAVAAAILAGGYLVFRGRRAGAWLLAVLVSAFLASYTVSAYRLGGEAMLRAALDPAQQYALEGNPMVNTTVLIAMTSINGILTIAAILWAGQAVGRSDE